MNSNPSSPVRAELAQMRIRLGNQFLVSAAILAPIALAVSLLRAIQMGWDSVVLLHAGMVVCICAMAWMRKRIHHNVKGAVLVGMFLTAGVTGVMNRGLLAPAMFYFVLVPFFASVLFGRWGAYAAVAAVVIAVAGTAMYIVGTGRLPLGDVEHYMTSPIAWGLELVVLLLVITFLLIAIEAFTHSLVKSLSSSYRHEKHLVLRNLSLQQTSDALHRAHAETSASLEANAAMVKRLDRVIRQTIDAFTTATVHTDPYTAGHERRMADLSLALGRKLGFDEDRLMGLELAARAHDIGQLKIPSEILLRPHALSALEFKFVQLHAEAGWEILRWIDFPWPVAEIVRQHHENFDGTGYPSGLRGDAILLEARIIRAADMVEALSSHRPFRAACTREEVIQQIAAARGCALDPRIADLCLEILAQGYAFPPTTAPTAPPITSKAAP